MGVLIAMLTPTQGFIAAIRFTPIGTAALGAFGTIGGLNCAETTVPDPSTDSTIDAG